MKNSKTLAGLIGPSVIAITISETLNAHIWATNTAPGVHLNGTLLFVAGLSIIIAHNYWVWQWPLAVTLIGWGAALLGLFRMFAPELQLQGAQNTTVISVVAMVVLTWGLFLTFKAYVHKLPMK